MAERKRNKWTPTDGATAPKETGRQNYKTVGIPAALYDELAVLAREEERSVQWMARKAIRQFIDVARGGRPSV